MSQTIYGKVDWPSGVIKFGDPPCATRVECIVQDIPGCIEWTGEHAGMVKINIIGADNSDCNDIYYGCVDWATGKFQISIPSWCCCEECPEMAWGPPIDTGSQFTVTWDTPSYGSSSAVCSWAAIVGLNRWGRNTTEIPRPHDFCVLDFCGTPEKLVILYFGALGGGGIEKSTPECDQCLNSGDILEWSVLSGSYEGTYSVQKV